jgi:hypothetical protein
MVAFGRWGYFGADSVGEVGLKAGSSFGGGRR